jgi:hypothetical protein
LKYYEDCRVKCDVLGRVKKFKGCCKNFWSDIKEEK